VDGLDVVPSLLAEGSQEVESHDGVESDLIICHGFITAGDVQVGDFLELPFHGTSDVIDLFADCVVLGHWKRELTNSVQDWPKDNVDLLNDRVSSQKDGVLLGPLLDLLLVFVELLEVIERDDINVDSSGFGLIGVLLIGNEADLHVWSWDVWKFDGT